ncbi:MAG: type II toxin-antitoxin system VapC family toxin [Lentisphaerae bacterium]|jgi:predicted nucleic acid-binding protein|nr:type II toxin-antitoxin system VapC family toxin [Lentisphaerota bacterium]
MLFDTDVIIWAFRGNSEAQHEINNAKPRQISIITYMELLQGARNKHEQKHIKQFLKAMSFEVLPITANISHRAAILIEEYALKAGLNISDALIFATANEHAIRLCSSNEKHFRHLPDLDTKPFRPNPQKSTAKRSRQKQ